MNGETTVALRAVVDRNRCCGYGICAEVCPEVYKIDDQGFAYVDGDVPPELEDAAREGCDACPDEAIVVESIVHGDNDSNGAE
jgi:ferredoxin